VIKAFWHISDNFGDKITPYILEKIKQEYTYVDKGCDQEHYIICGSILTACNEHSVIWGAGIAQPYDLIAPKQILAVRGTKTREFLLSKGVECPELYGDPAMMLPLLYQPQDQTKKRKIGYIPHVIDYVDEGWDLNKSVEQTIDFIVQSEQIKSSSLHAIITAWTYGVPFEIIWSENVIGQRFKFADFLETQYDIETFIKSFPFIKKL
jgi:pyruvyltransferase